MHLRKIDLILAFASDSFSQFLLVVEYPQTPA